MIDQVLMEQDYARRIQELRLNGSGADIEARIAVLEKEKMGKISKVGKQIQAVSTPSYTKNIV